MRTRKIVKARDLLATQQRITILLDCQHTVSITVREIQAHPFKAFGLQPFIQETWECPFCADPPPEVVRGEKSATQLWREAGEP